MKRIMCFGDSNTWGAIPNDSERYPQEVRWTGVLARELGEGYQIIEEGHNGRTTVFTDPIERRMAGIDYFYPCLESQVPLDLVIIMLGTNDLKTRFGVKALSIADGLRRYDNILKSVHMAGEPPKVLLISPILLHPDYKKHVLFHDMFGEDAVERSRGFREAYQMAAEQFGWYFMSASDFAEASPKDGLHMEPEGHASLGRAVAGKVREIL